jgi:hypothetical protein
LHRGVRPERLDALPVGVVLAQNHRLTDRPETSVYPEEVLLPQAPEADDLRAQGLLRAGAISAPRIAVFGTSDSMRFQGAV